MTSNWITFWNKPDIYNDLNSNFKQKSSKRFFKQLIKILGIEKSQRILDFGCGEAITAPSIVEKGHQLYLYDRSTFYSQRAKELFQENKQIQVLSDDQYNSLSNDSIDVIVVSSVIQYLTPAEVEETLKKWHPLLPAGGRVILADVVPPKSNAIIDAIRLFFTSVKIGILPGFFQLMLSHFKSAEYNDLRNELDLYKYTPEDIKHLGSSSGYEVEKHFENLGLINSRKTFILTKK